VTVAFYTRLGCHLCEEARSLLDASGFAYETFDVDDDRQLLHRYGERVPVVEVDGVVVAVGNLAGVPLKRLLAKVVG
jgi:glutaredoxin